MTRHDMLVDTLRKVAPGTPLREGLDSIVRAHTGALVVVSSAPEADVGSRTSPADLPASAKDNATDSLLESSTDTSMQGLMEGGFRLDTPFNPSALYELSKMDGAIVIDEAVERILAANVQLVPTMAFRSAETGIRHRTAERVARQTGALVIAVSERRNVVTVYRSQLRYVLHDLGYLLVKATQAVSSLMQYDNLLAAELSALSLQEWQGQAHAGLVAHILRRASVLARMQDDLELMVAEMGREGRVVEWQMADVQDELVEVGAVWRDYGPPESPLPDDQLTKSLAVWGERIGIVPSDPDHVVEPRGFRFLTRLAGLSPHRAEHALARVQGGWRALYRAEASELAEEVGLSRFEQSRIVAARRTMEARAHGRSAEVEHPEGP